MSIVNQILGAITNALLVPFRALPPIVGLAFVSLLGGILALLVIKRMSNQEALVEVKRKIFAGIFEIRLFNDDFRAIMRAQGEILRHNMTYLWLSLVPVVVLLPVFVVVLFHLEPHYYFKGLEPGDETVLKVTMADAFEPGSEKPEIDLVLPSGLKLDTPSVWAPELGEMVWRLEAEERGSYEVEVRMDGESWTKSVQVQDGMVLRSPVRPPPTILDQIRYPAEPSMPKGASIRSISIDYTQTDIELLGISWPFWLWFFALSIVFAFMLRNRMGVTI